MARGSWQALMLPLAMLAVAVIAATMVDLGLRLSGVRAQQPLQSFAVAAAKVEQDDALEHWHLMGHDRVQALSPTSGGETHLPLHLQGLFSDVGGHHAAALLLLPGQGKAQWVRVGDDVGSGSVLAAVHPQYIVLRRGDGQLETLHLQPPTHLLTPETAGGDHSSTTVQTEATP